MTINEVLAYLALYGPTLLTVVGTLIATFKVDQKTKKSLGGIAQDMVVTANDMLRLQKENAQLKVQLTRIEDKQERLELKILESTDEVKSLRKALGVSDDQAG